VSMEFIAFCRSHGVRIDRLPPVGRWVRYRTDDNPRKYNGAVKYLGDIGFCQNWACMEAPALWHAKSERGAAPIDFARVRREAEAARQNALDAQRRAAQRARAMLEQSKQDYHPYLAKKGFAKACAAVLDDKLLVPMFYAGSLCGLQVIDEDGSKRFLQGQRCAGAHMPLGTQGLTVLCEGYATGLSVAAVFAALKRPVRVVVGFSAGNLPKLAQNLPQGLLLADNDKSGTGQRIARQIGWPCWISDKEGEDFNDAHQRLGDFVLGMAVQRVLLAKTGDRQQSTGTL